MNRDELTNALSNAQSIQISVSTYIDYLSLREERDQSIRASLEKEFSNEHEGDPFFHGCKDLIIQYREAIISITRFGNPNLYHNYKTMSDKEFFEEINK